MYIYTYIPFYGSYKFKFLGETFSLLWLLISIIKNNRIILSPFITFIPKTGVGLPKTGATLYCVSSL